MLLLEHGRLIVMQNSLMQLKQQEDNLVAKYWELSLGWHAADAHQLRLQLDAVRKGSERLTAKCEKLRSRISDQSNV